MTGPSLIQSSKAKDRIGSDSLLLFGFFSVLLISIAEIPPLLKCLLIRNYYKINIRG